MGAGVGAAVGAAVTVESFGQSSSTFFSVRVIVLLEL